MATIDPALHTWLEEHEQLAQYVDLWFRKATSRFAAPSGVGCNSVAFYMMAFRHRVDDKKPDHRKQAIKYGKLFLYHIAFERREIEAMVSLASHGRPLGDWFEEHKETLCRIDETRRHIEAILRRAAMQNRTRFDFLPWWRKKPGPVPMTDVHRGRWPQMTHFAGFWSRPWRRSAWTAARRKSARF